MALRLPGLLVLVLTCVCAPGVASACWESPPCSDLGSKDKMLVREGQKKKHTHVKCASCPHVDVG